MRRKGTITCLATLAMLFVACGPAATATPPRATTSPTATAAPSGPAATAQPSPTPRVVATAAPAAAKPKYGGVLKTFTDRDPRGWDGWKNKSGSRDIRTQHNLNFSMLFSYPATPEADCRLELTPELAESWKWTTDKTLDIKIRQGVKFQNKAPVNGRELTAQDVAWSANQFILDKTIRGMETMAPHVTKIEATDKYTVRFNTDNPMPTLITEGLTAVYGAVILPPEVVDAKGEWNDPAKSYIGSGPFMFKEYRPGVSITYVKHPSYFKTGLPYVDEVKQLVIGDQSTVIAALRSGSIDVIWMKVPQTMALPLQHAPGIRVQSCLQYAAMPARIWMHTDKPPFSDIRVRRAVSMALDREGMVKSILQGFGVTAPLLPPEVHPFHVSWSEVPPEIKRWVTYNPQEAKKLLAEAGYPNGLEIDFTNNTAYLSPQSEVAEAVIALLGAVGFKVNAKWVSQPEWAYISSSGDYNGIAFGTAEPASLLGVTGAWHSGSIPNPNRAFIRDPEVDRLIDAFNTATDLEKSKQLFKQLELRVIDQAWEITPGTFPQEFTAARDYVKDFRGGYYWYMNTWVERVWLSR